MVERSASKVGGSYRIQIDHTYPILKKNPVDAWAEVFRASARTGMSYLANRRTVREAHEARPLTAVIRSAIRG